MEQQNESWFVRSHGVTLGPLTGRELAFSLDRGDFLPLDKVCARGERQWTQFSHLSRFRGFFRDPEEMRAEIEKLSPPPLLSLRKRPHLQEVPPLPARSELEQELAPESALETMPLAEAALEIPSATAVITTAAIESSESSETSEPEPTKEAAPSLLERSAEIEPKISLAASMPKSEKTEEIERAEEKEERFFLPPLNIDHRWFGIPDMDTNPQIPNPSARSAHQPVIQIELRLPKRNIFIVALFFVGLGLAGATGFWLSQNKTRDLKDFRLPDPSSPTATLSTEGDPNPPLKAPTRPQRD